MIVTATLALLSTASFAAAKPDTKPGPVINPADFVSVVDNEFFPRQYAQESAPGVAQDMARVLSLDRSACVPYGCFDDLLLPREWSPLTPGMVEHKFYAEGVGFIPGLMVKGGNELTELVTITTGQ